MSSFDRRALLIGVFTMAGCGFQPVFDTNAQGRVRTLWGRVALPSANDADSYAIRKTLAGYFGESVSPDYRLEIDYSSSSTDLAITQNALVTRKRLTASGTYQAIDLRTGQSILNQKFRRIASYSVNDDRFAADEITRSTSARLASTIADDFAVRFISAVTIGQ